MPASQFIFASAPFASCHASTVVELRDGTLMAAWFGGSAEGHPDVAIWGSRRTAAGWSAPAELAREPNVAAYNPVLFYTGDGHLWLYYKFGPSPSSWSAARRSSADHGQTWSETEYLPAGLYGPIRAKPFVRDNGVVVSGTSVESYHSWACWIERSTDHGQSWTRHGPITLGAGAANTCSHNVTSGIIQPTVLPIRGGLRFYARSTECIGHICVADSTDDGITWTPARPLALPNPNSGIDAVAVGGGRVVLVYNHTTRGRTPLNLAVSSDAEHFRMFQTLEDEPGEYSYPTMVQARNGDLLITYTWRRERIKFVRFPLADVP